MKMEYTNYNVDSYTGSIWLVGLSRNECFLIFLGLGEEIS